MHGLNREEVKKSGKIHLSEIGPTAVALFFALGMTYIMINSGGAAGNDSMLIVIAKTLSSIVGKGCTYLLQ